MSMPSKQECCYILEMLEAKLIDSSYTQPWAEQLIEETDVPPAWLCDLAIKTYTGHQKDALRGYISSEPFEEAPGDLEKFYLACLWLRYERRELSWATFLDLAGEHLDCVAGNWDCETPYHYLNMHEDAYFSVDSESDTKRQYLADQDLLPFIDLAKQKFELFRMLRRVDKVAMEKHTS
jgi:hypothetical protein